MLNPKLKQAAESLKSTYNSAYEYPHTVFDNFVDPTIIKDVEVEARMLTNNSENAWRFGGGNDEHSSQLLKRGIKELDKMLPSMNLLCRYFNNPEFLEFLRELTGIEDLIGDWSFEGGGFHVTYPGGLLNIHHDFNYTDNMGPDRMYRKVNLLVYLNEDWEKEWGGELELWKSDVSSKFKSIVPQFNRAVLFNIEDAPHGHPDPLQCPEGECRRSLAFYYYSKSPNTNKLYDRAHWKHGNQLL
jgi:Rps23 Pro-64 3,4-dihydroxylase Tpa1-like proline 4-hydroxylase